MTLRQTLQAAPAKTKELVEKLKGTSNQAVKTRESLFAELKEQLTLYLDQEDQHLLPILRKHAETKALASDAAKAGKEMRARLKDIDGSAKDNDEFGAKIAELQALLQQHVRNERKELLPAVLKALDDEEAANVAVAIETGFADAEKAKRDERRKAAEAAERAAEREKEAQAAERAKQARAAERAKEAQAAERAKEAQAAERAAARAQKAEERAVREQAEKLQQAAAAPLVRAVEQTNEAASQAQAALGTYTGTFQKAAADLRAFSAARSVAAEGASKFMSAWAEWLSTSTRAQAEGSRRLLQCRNFAQLAELQGEMLTNSTRSLVEGNTALLEIAQQTSKQALRALEAPSA